MAREEKDSETIAREPRLRKPAQAQPEEQAAEAEPTEEERATLESRTGFKTEKNMGGRVRVARAVDPAKLAAAPGGVEGVEASQDEGSGAAGPEDEVGAREASEASPEPVRFQEDVTTEDFAALLAGEVQSAAPQTMEFGVGDQIRGTIVAVGSTYLFVSIGSSKVEGMAVREDYVDEDGELTVSEGDTLDFYVLSLRGGEIVLGEKLGGREGAMQAIEVARDTGAPIEGRVESANKGGFVVQIGRVEAFCPISQIETGFTEEPAVHVGNTYRFQVTEIREGGRSVVVSRAELQRAERRKRAAEIMEKLQPGAVLGGTVTRVADFGAFVDVGGVEGLVHVSELAHSYFDKASDVVKQGDQVEVVVLRVEEEEGRDTPKIGLSMKAAVKSPWETVNERFAVGQQVEGTVVRLAPFGAFVEIAPGLDGLVHVSEMSWREHVKHPRDIVEAGQRVRVEVQDIDQVRERIGLSMKAVEGDPWEVASERYQVGMEVTGIVENVQEFGVFVRLDAGVTALIPRSEITLPAGVGLHRRYTQGNEVTVRVLNVNAAEQKMALTEKSARDIAAAQAEGGAEAERRKKESGPRSFEDSSGGFGTLGDLLAGKLK